MVKLITQILSLEGFEVEGVVNPKDAAGRIKTKGYHLLLLDYKMPYMTGFELYEYIQKINPSQASRVVFMISNSNLSTKPVSDFLSKTKAPFIVTPFTTEKFVAEVFGLLVQLNRSAK